MKNFLIMSKKINFVKKIIDFINEEELSKINLITSYKDIQRNIYSNIVDIMIIESKLTNKEVNDIIELLDSTKKCTIIVLINYNNNNYKKYDNLYILNENDNIQMLFLKKLIESNYIEEKEEIIEKKIYNKMTNIGFEMKNKGDILLLEAIKYIKINGKIKSNLNNEVYPYISNKTNIPVNQIKWNIIYSLNKIYKYNLKDMENYFNIKITNNPTVKYVIYKILEGI